MAHKAAVAAVAAVALAAFLFMGFFVVDAGIQSSLHDVTIENESFTPDGGNLTTFQNSNLNRAEYDEDVTVTNKTDGTGTTFQQRGDSADPQDDYIWFESNGTLKTIAGSDLDNQAEAFITYGYNGQTLEQTKATNIVVNFMGVLPILGFVGFVSFLAISLFVLGRWA